MGRLTFLQTRCHSWQCGDPGAFACKPQSRRAHLQGITGNRNAPRSFLAGFDGLELLHALLVFMCMYIYIYVRVLLKIG